MRLKVRQAAEIGAERSFSFKSGFPIGPGRRHHRHLLRDNTSGVPQLLGNFN